MPKPRSPLAKAKSLGADRINPSRYANRREAPSTALGAPSTWLNADQALAWTSFQRELPWLCERDRALVEIATVIRSRLMNGEDVGVQALNLLRQALGQMGATPADSSKAPLPDDQAAFDPLDEYLN